MIPGRSETIFRKRLRKFRRLKRGYYSFVLILSVYVISFLLPFLMSGTPLVVRHQGRFYFPMFNFYSVTDFGVEGYGEPDYRVLKKQFAEAGQGDWVLMPPYPYGPNEALLDLTESPPNAPSRAHPFGTDDRGRDVFVRLAYGFNISMTFAIMVTLFSESAGRGRRRAAGLLRRKDRHHRPADHRDLVVASVSLHDHHHQLDHRPDLRAGQICRLPAFVLAARCDSGGVRLGGDHLLHPWRVLPGESKDYVGAAIATGVSPSRRSCSGTFCRTR